MHTDWFLVANASKARLFRRPSPQEPLITEASLEHPESRLRGTSLAADRPGHVEADQHKGGTSFAEPTDPRRKEHRHFAQELAVLLAERLSVDRHDRLVVLASSPFLGELKAELQEATHRCLQGTVDIDLTAYGLSELEERLARVLAQHRT